MVFRVVALTIPCLAQFVEHCVRLVSRYAYVAEHFVRRVSWYAYFSSRGEGNLVFAPVIIMLLTLLLIK